MATRELYQGWVGVPAGVNASSASADAIQSVLSSVGLPTLDSLQEVNERASSGEEEVSLQYVKITVEDITL